MRAHTIQIYFGITSGRESSNETVITTYAITAMHLGTDIIRVLFC